VGVARRLAILLWRILTTGEAYTPGIDHLDEESPSEA
jgi:hypothetical protein